MSDLPDGWDWYAFNVKRMTTTDLTPEEIHEWIESRKDPEVASPETRG